MGTPPRFWFRAYLRVKNDFMEGFGVNSYKTLALGNFEFLRLEMPALKRGSFFESIDSHSFF
ncbi:hypothetical protein JWG45_11650 [Leptospira sp. 201903070]|uniref:Uncharacterized protein n=1 Tax=Leptospira ainlahdjerensis TaxID=2810033 RepID=A0ABS2UDF7_9LEPT|nr:hypothetical protein [Leptospira ainlahdjerensis]MBM9577804.1 hypothetical protein [Leptospira ainlahdjerensis]